MLLARRTYDLFVKEMRNIALDISKLSMRSAIEKEILRSENEETLIVSGNGSWRKRGFQSLHGIAALIGHYTGKVVDVVVKSSYYAACKLWEPRSGTEEYLEWLENHEEECQANHQGCASKMEVDAILDMFKKSVDNYGVKYKNYVGDGDKTFKSILNEQPYGENYEIIKKRVRGARTKKSAWGTYKKEWALDCVSLKRRLKGSVVKGN